VPRSHLYKVLEDLHTENLVDILLEGGSRAYRARPFADFLCRRAEQLRAQLAEVELQMTTLGEVLRPPESNDQWIDSGEVRFLMGRRAVANEIDDLLEDAKREVVIAASDHGVDRLARQLSPHWEQWSRAGRTIHVTLILPKSARWSADWNDLPAGAKIELRQFNISRPTFAVIVDQERMVHIHPIPDTADVRSGRDIGLSSDDKAYAASHRDLLIEASRPYAAARDDAEP